MNQRPRIDSVHPRNLITPSGRKWPTGNLPSRITRNLRQILMTNQWNNPKTLTRTKESPPPVRPMRCRWERIYVYMCLYMCIYMHMHMYIYMYVYVYARVCLNTNYMHIHIHVNIYTYISIHIYVCLCIYTYIHLYACVYNTGPIHKETINGKANSEILPKLQGGDLRPPTPPFATSSWLQVTSATLLARLTNISLERSRHVPCLHECRRCRRPRGRYDGAWADGRPPQFHSQIASFTLRTAGNCDRQTNKTPSHWPHTQMYRLANVPNKIYIFTHVHDPKHTRIRSVIDKPKKITHAKKGPTRKIEQTWINANSEKQIR